MYRMRPLWYRDGLSDILSLCSSTLTDDQPKNLALLPSFPGPELESDGIHLTSYSGLQFILHLYDSCTDVLSRPKLQPDVRVSRSDESSRLLLDKFVVLEKDHRRLDHAFETKSAVDAEYRDFLENQQHEDHLLVSGLEAAGSDLSGRDWQDFVKVQLDALFRRIVDRSCPIIFIQNNTGRNRDETLYQVRLEKVEDSRAIRSKFGFFFMKGEDKRPEEIKDISIRNWVTHGTRVRLAIMKVLGQRYRTSNQGSKMKLISYEPRPMLHLIPAPDSREKRVKRFNFIEAVTRLPTCFSKAEVNSIMKAVGRKFTGQLRSLFIVISDDLRHGSAPPGRAQASDGSSVNVDEVEDEVQALGASEHAPSGSRTGRKRLGSSADPRSSKSSRTSKNKP
jgi:hypothetical protein